MILPLDRHNVISDRTGSKRERRQKVSRITRFSTIRTVSIRQSQDNLKTFIVYRTTQSQVKTYKMGLLDE